MIVPPNPHEPHFPDEYNATDIELPAQRILSKEFEAIEIWNQLAVLDFDPSVPRSVVEIRLDTAFPEAEAAEPTVTDAKCINMLSSLGLTFQWLKDEDPSKVFQQEYIDGSINQLRLMTRQDGAKIPVFTKLASDQEGNAIESISLLSNDVATEHVKRLEDSIDEQKVDIRLQEVFGLDNDFTKSASLSFEDKKAMLATHDKINALEIAMPDTKELDKLRSKFVKGMLPAASFLGRMRDKHLAKTQVQYEKGVVDLINRYELSGIHVSDLIANERARRLVELNEQLKKRVIAHKVGLVAMTGVASAVGSAWIGDMSQSFEGNPTIPAIAGGVFGLLLGIQDGMVLRNKVRGENIRFLPNTEKGDNSEGSSFTEQLAQERYLAGRYSFKLDRK